MFTRFCNPDYSEYLKSEPGMPYLTVAYHILIKTTKLGKYELYGFPLCAKFQILEDYYSKNPSWNSPLNYISILFALRQICNEKRWTST